MTRSSTSTRLILAAIVAAFMFAAIQGCSSDPPKNGVAIQKDDYTNAPGGGKPPPGKT